MTQLDLALGLALKDEGMARAAAGNDKFLDLTRAWAIQHSRWFGQVTADDVRQWAESIGLHPSSPHVWGSIFRDKGWRVIGHHRSAIANNHGHEYRVWHWVGA